MEQSTRDTVSETKTEATVTTKKEEPKLNFPLIVIGASIGGFVAIQNLVAGLPAKLGAAVLIVWHMSPDVRGMLPDVINRAGTLPASHATDLEIIQENHVYVAPPDFHLIVEGNMMRITKGPKENRFRPAVDPLFRSAAFACGKGVIGIILTGALDDGTSGLWMVKHRGGTAIAQQPEDAEMPSMPQSAIRYVPVDYVVPLTDMPHLLVNLVKEYQLTPTHKVMKKDESEKIESDIAANENALNGDVFKLGELTSFTCPECHGVLTSIMEGNYKRFRCHTGHAFSIDSLLAALTENIEENLWNAIRSIKESSMLLNHIGDHFAEHNETKLAAEYFRKAQEADQRARQVRDVVTHHEQLNQESIEHEAEDGYIKAQNGGHGN